MSTNTENFEKLVKKDYEHGFVTDIDADTIPPGLSEEIITFIHNKRKPTTHTKLRRYTFKDKNDS